MVTNKNVLKYSLLLITNKIPTQCHVGIVMASYSIALENQQFAVGPMSKKKTTTQA